ncbi:MAG: hypothetical protein JW776_06215 [Candidatus Lokiarchaeota archaeon]|nr:hypothetical protein [Candidatus Lokiarchaeota archaeon]
MDYRTFEGDFLETKEGLIFDVKGIIQPEMYKIAYLRYMPVDFFNRNYANAPKTKKFRIQKEIEKKYSVDIADVRFAHKNFIKIYDIESRFRILSQFKPEYIFRSELFDFPLQAVPIRDIKTIHVPEVYLQEKLESEPEESLKNLVMFIHEGSDIPVSHIGLSGSYMVGLNQPKSDYDLIIYGEVESHKVHAFLEDRFSHSKSFQYGSSLIKTYTGRLMRTHFKNRGAGFHVPFRDFKRMELQKTHQFLIDGRDVFLRYIEICRNDINLPDFNDFSYKGLDRVILRGEIVNDSKSIFTPGSYKLQINSIQKSIHPIPIEEIEIFTFRGRFLEQARKGDKVLVNGKLEQEKINSLNEIRYRVVLGTDPNDKMIQINRSNVKLS